MQRHTTIPWPTPSSSSSSLDYLLLGKEIHQPPAAQLGINSNSNDPCMPTTPTPVAAAAVPHRVPIHPGLAAMTMRLSPAMEAAAAAVAAFQVACIYASHSRSRCLGTAVQAVQLLVAQAVLQVRPLPRWITMISWSTMIGTQGSCQRKRKSSGTALTSRTTPFCSS